MKVTIHEHVDSGAYADVYRATDALGRTVAAKLLRPSAGDEEFAISQAQALARAEHPNVVRVYSVEQVIDPSSGQKVVAIILEWIAGDTLNQYLKGPSKPVAELAHIGLEIVSALRHMHASGVVHSDLHLDNVMITDGHAKVIDALYYDSLAQLSSQSKQMRYESDAFGAKMVIRKLLSASELGLAVAEQFEANCNSGKSLDDIERAVRTTMGAGDQVDTVIQTLTLPSFVEEQEYAEALLKATPSDAVAPVLRRIITSGIAEAKHFHYLWRAFALIDDSSKSNVVAVLAKAIDTSKPADDWWPHLIALTAFGQLGWDSLPETVKIKIEKTIVSDLSNGLMDYHSKNMRQGKIGSWAPNFWKYFHDRDQLIEALSKKLSSNQWDEANYAAEAFMADLPEIADTLPRRRQLQRAIAKGIQNSSKTVKAKLTSLPSVWQTAIGKLL